MGVKHCCSKHFRWEMYALQHELTSDFYVSCWQKNRSTLPLFCLRAVLFLGCLGILIASMVMWDAGTFGHFFVYLTHWGVILITLATGAACGVSARAYFRGPVEGTFGLPLYIKTYWALFNAATTIAIFISIFYFAFLTNVESGENTQKAVLEFFTHGANSIIMVVLLMSSRHPARLQHVYYPIIFALVYLLFNLIYYFAGGVSAFDTKALYPMLDWSEDPGLAVATVFGSAGAITLVHIVVFALAKLRDYVAIKYTRSTKSISIINQ